MSRAYRSDTQLLWPADAYSEQHRRSKLYNGDE
jgi:hypothetical protein